MPKIIKRIVIIFSLSVSWKEGEGDPVKTLCWRPVQPVRWLAFLFFVFFSQPKKTFSVLQIVAETIQRVWDKGDIYRAEYEGLYCVACEEYKDEKDLIGTEADGSGEKVVCPTHR